MKWIASPEAAGAGRRGIQRWLGGAAEAGSTCADLARRRVSWAKGKLSAKLRPPQQPAGRHPVTQSRYGIGRGRFKRDLR